MLPLRSNALILVLSLCCGLALCTAGMAGYYVSQPVSTIRFQPGPGRSSQKNGDPVLDLIKRRDQIKAELDVQLKLKEQLEADKKRADDALVAAKKTARSNDSPSNASTAQSQREALKKLRAGAKGPDDIRAYLHRDEATFKNLMSAWEDPTTAKVNVAVSGLTTHIVLNQNELEKARNDRSMATQNQDAMIKKLREELEAIDNELNSSLAKRKESLEEPRGMMGTIEELIRKARAPKPAQVGQDYTNTIGMRMIWINDFWISEKEVTQGQLKKMGLKDTSTWQEGADGAPANNVTWSDAMRFCIALNKDPTEQLQRLANYQYILPSVQQWRSVNNPAVKNLQGDVSEWCKDKFEPAMAQSNQRAGIVNALFSPESTSGRYCVLGASWDPHHASADFSKGIWPQHPDDKGIRKGFTKDEYGAPGSVNNRLANGDIGFRVVLTPK